MFPHTLVAVFFAASTVSAWPLVFFPTADCHSDPVAVFHEAPAAGQCVFFEEEVMSYSGATDDPIQKVLLYYHAKTCVADAAHRVYANHTVNNTLSECYPFKTRGASPQAFTFIEELLPLPPVAGNSSGNSSFDASCNPNAFRVQS